MFFLLLLLAFHKQLVMAFLSSSRSAFFAFSLDKHWENTSKLHVFVQFTRNEIVFQKRYSMTMAIVCILNNAKNAVNVRIEFNAFKIEREIQDKVNITIRKEFGVCVRNVSFLFILWCSRSLFRSIIEIWVEIGLLKYSFIFFFTLHKSIILYFHFNGKNRRKAHTLCFPDIFVISQGQWTKILKSNFVF